MMHMVLDHLDHDHHRQYSFRSAVYQYIASREGSNHAQSKLLQKTWEFREVFAIDLQRALHKSEEEKRGL